MCEKNACAASRAAKRHVGVQMLGFDAIDANNVQFIMDMAADDGVTLATVDDVVSFALGTVATFMAARTAYDLTEKGGK